MDVLSIRAYYYGTVDCLTVQNGSPLTIVRETELHRSPDGPNAREVIDAQVREQTQDSARRLALAHELAELLLEAFTSASSLHQRYGAWPKRFTLASMPSSLRPASRAFAGASSPPCEWRTWISSEAQSTSAVPFPR